MERRPEDSCREQRPSLRVLLIPRLLARGIPPWRAAHTAGVPLALVDFILEAGMGGAPAGARESRAGSGGTGAAGARRGRPGRGEPKRHSRAAALLATAAVYTAAAALTALCHLPLMLPAIAVAAFLARRP